MTIPSGPKVSLQRNNDLSCFRLGEQDSIAAGCRCVDAYMAFDDVALWRHRFGNQRQDRAGAPGQRRTYRREDIPFGAAGDGGNTV